MTEIVPLVAVYADESCLGNGREGDNPGGAGGVVETLHPRTGAVVRRDYWVSEPGTTNNRMALRSAIEVFRALDVRARCCRVVFASDSQYLIHGAERWVHDWARRGWKRKGGAIENLALWQELVEVGAPHRVQWRWIRGHRGHPQNEYANLLATRAAARQSRSDGLVPSEFDEWLEIQRSRGRISLAPDPMPDPATFRAGPPLPGGASPRLL